jgi:hypothetical protein
VLLVLLAASLAIPQAAHAALNCRPTTIYSVANGKYVSTEMGETGPYKYMLRARATKIGPWEKYDICFDDVSHVYFIKSRASGLWVSAELGYTGALEGLLRARASSRGSWERFIGITHEEVWNFRSAPRFHYVSAELGYLYEQNGLLRARATAAGPWEAFGLLFLG